MSKISIRFWNDREVRAIWGEESHQLGIVNTQFNL